MPDERDESLFRGNAARLYVFTVVVGVLFSIAVLLVNKLVATPVVIKQVLPVPISAPYAVPTMNVPASSPKNNSGLIPPPPPY